MASFQERSEIVLTYFMREATDILPSSVGYTSPKTQRTVKTDPAGSPPAIYL